MPRIKSRHVIIAVLALLIAAPAQARDRLPDAVARSLSAAHIPPAAVAVLVQGVDEARPRLAINSGQAMNPASVMKLLTTYAALDLLGPAYTWKTGAYVDSAPVDGVLKGKLYLKGSGDPRLTQEQFWLLLRQLRARGIRQIDGDLVLDRSAFDLRDEDPAPFDDKPLRPYNVGPDALLVNFNSLRFTLAPNPARNAVDVVPEFRPDSLDIVNLIRIGGGDCGEWKDALQAEQSVVASGYRLTLSGTYPAACEEKDWHLAVLPHVDYVAAMFRNLWRELGGSFTGKVVDGGLSFNAQPIAEIESPSLAEVIRDINKYSNNVMARQLYLTLGLEAGHRPARPADAEAVVRAWLAVKGLNFPGLTLDNGSGLSRRERIDAASLGQLLRSAWASPLMPEFVASLPLASVDGTMKKRLNDAGVRGQAHVKTGSLDNAKAIAGYVRGHDGRYSVVVFLVNHPNAAAAQAAQDALLQWVYASGR